jgi:hypothetical protein
MQSETRSKIIIFLIFIILFFIIQIISGYYNNRIRIKYEKSIVRPSYGDEFWNYGMRGADIGDNIEEAVVKDNIEEQIIEEQIIEGFGFFETPEDAIRGTHQLCPVMEGNRTSITSCIHFPNNNIQGLPGPVDDGFLISVCCDDCINIIQKSLNSNNGEYNIIYEGGNYILTKNNEQKQIVFQCNEENLNMINRTLRN